jgi:ectoine hydroxylase-related dioxygenase (phytanoyl-CoA dioxygenase family)
MHSTGYYSADACDLGEFTEIISQTTDKADVPHASAVEKNIPIYDMGTLRPALEDATQRQNLMAEWAQVLLHGAGIVALKGAYADTSVLDEATDIYENIIAEEKEGPAGGGDHFAAAGANDRIWNSLQKLCEKSPDVFLRYFANAPIAAICEAWLGLNYQMTAQVNLVHPGGAAQQAHRDYHLGFQSAEQTATYPAHVHDLSPVLTLQGAVAHCDMSVESGPTKLLPFSQTYRSGYAAWRRDDFRAVFEESYVQLPLSKGDAVFFSPALFHAAGANTSTDIHRMANLLQVSSAFGRAMETFDRNKMCNLVYGPLGQLVKADALTPLEVSAAIAATAEGYSFPTNLDTDPPKAGLAPETQAAYLARALKEDVDQAAFEAHLMDMQKARHA